MCGITGYITNKKDRSISKNIIYSMTKILSHRGPDDAGCVLIDPHKKSYSTFCNPDEIISFSTAKVGLGHRRLSIIDLSKNGHQPMSDKGGKVWLVFNGEIYNYIEIKAQLEQKGYSFKSKTDTEVILKSYIEWGTQCFNKFNGMWAIAIYDLQKKNIILSRDRFGKKPLYYYLKNSEFIFASEIKSIFQHPMVEKEPDYEKIYRYLSTNYRYIDGDDNSFFKNIFQVPKSSYITIDENFRIEKQNYWYLTTTKVNNSSYKDLIDQYKNLLINSIRIRLRSDVSVGCFLSGGMDSTSITCIAYHILNQPITTFSGITGNIKGVYDESPYINSVIKHVNADYYYIRPDPKNIFDIVMEMLSFHDEPICTITWYSMYLIVKEIGTKNIPVMLNGHGCDECMAGYWDYYHYHFYDMFRMRDLNSLSEEKKYWYDNHKRDKNELKQYEDYIKKILNNDISEMSRFPDYSSCFIEDIQNKYKGNVKYDIPEYTSLLTRRMFSDLFYETVPPVLRAEDRNTMSCSIESRSPFLDYRLVELCYSLPNKYKIRDGIGKWLLREAMKGILPENVRLRKDKSGFIAPAGEWFRTVNKKQIYDLIRSDTFSKRGIFNVPQVKFFFEEHVNQKKDHYMFIWQLINLELWFRFFFDN